MGQVMIMDIQAEKDELIRILSGISEVKQIEQLKAFMLTVLRSSPPVTPTWEEKSAIDKGLRSIDEGRIKSHEEVMSLTRKKYPHLFE